jgi:ATP-binding cassette subfamily F protein uup
MLGDYPGTVVVVSHDRDFLDRVASSVIVSEGEGRWTEYAGGYSDMVAQRGFGVTAAAAATKPSRGGRPAPLAPLAPAGKQKLSFKQKHALETLPQEMARLQQEVAAHRRVLADTGLYARDANAFATTSKALAEAEGALAAAEDRWLELEELRERLEG